MFDNIYNIIDTYDAKLSSGQKVNDTLALLTASIDELSARTIVEATVFPDFRSAELCEAYGTKDPVQVPGKMLLAGEFGRLIDAVSKLSGFDKSLDEEAKN